MSITIWKASASLMSFQQYWMTAFKNPVQAFLALVQQWPRHVSTRFHRRPGTADINDHTLFAQLGEDSSSLVGKLQFVLSVAVPLSMSIGQVWQPVEDPSLGCKKLVVSLACSWLSSSMETISMVIWFSSCVVVLELMIAPFFVQNKMLRPVLLFDNDSQFWCFLLESVWLHQQWQ